MSDSVIMGIFNRFTDRQTGPASKPALLLRQQLRTPSATQRQWRIRQRAEALAKAQASPEPLHCDAAHDKSPHINASHKVDGISAPRPCITAGRNAFGSRSLTTEKRTANRAVGKEIRETSLALLGETYDLKQLTSGGVCHVYHASASNPVAPQLAVKMLKSAWMDLDHMRKQFAFEAQIIKGLDHPLMPRFIHFGQATSLNYLAYEFLPGRTLISCAQKKQYFGQPSALKLSIGIMMDVFEQLHYLHTKPDPIVHGDISAENIILAPNGRAHLVDFGCAHLRNTPPADYQKYIGKPSYLSPEQARGEAWSAPSDVYQAGILFYELIVGRRWLRGKCAKTKLLKAASRASPAPHFLSKKVPGELSRLVAKCLHANPLCRPRDLLELITDLKHIRLNL